MVSTWEADTFMTWISDEPVSTPALAPAPAPAIGMEENVTMCLENSRSDPIRPAWVLETKRSGGLETVLCVVTEKLEFHSDTISLAFPFYLHTAPVIPSRLRLGIVNASPLRTDRPYLWFTQFLCIVQLSILRINILF